ncbi:MAG: tetratricopeptide repeat protein [Candidatus Pacebacteria bacterium]|nr:tetratricopeptide repeat protein [Candidatus Paceibacterota bacterium]
MSIANWGNATSSSECSLGNTSLTEIENFNTDDFSEATKLSPPRLRAEAKIALRDGDPVAAEKAYQAALGLEPADIHALVGLGLVARLRGNHEEALRCFQDASIAWPSSTWPLLESSIEFGALKQRDEEEAVLRRALQINSRDYHTLMTLGYLLRRRGRREEALQMFQSAAIHHPAAASGYIEAGEELVRLGRWKEAVAKLDEGAAAGASRLEIFCAKARALRSEGQSDAALSAWAVALANNPQNASLKLEIATEAINLGRTADAFAVFQAVVEDSELTSTVRRDAALSAAHFARKTDRPLALLFFEQAATLDAEHLQAKFELAEEYRYACRFDEAEAIFRKVLDQAPTSVAALVGLTLVKRQRCLHKEALFLIRKAHELEPLNEGVSYQLGLSLQESGQTEDAKKILESIDPASSMYIWAQMSLGHIARAAADHLRAAKHFEQAARTAPDPTEALCELASERLALGRFDAAEELISQILGRDPESYRAHMAEGYLKRALKDRNGARAAFIHASAITPSEPQPWVELSNEESELGNRAASVAAIETALERDPRHEGALLKKGAYLAETGERAAALSIYESLREARPASIWAYLAEAQLLADQGAFASALETLATAREKCAINSQLELREAAIFRQQGLLDSAFERLSCAYERFPQELWPWFFRLSAAIDLGLYDIAEIMLATPPLVTEREIARVENMRAQLAKARWNLEAAIDNFGLAVSLDPEDLQAVYERAKLKLITFDLAGARQDLLSHAKRSVAAASREGRAANPSQTHVGQLYDEFVVDRDLASQFDALRRLAPHEQVSPLCETVRHFPDSTGAAIGLMIALRRSGRFDRPLTTLGGQPRIPRVITQFWNDPEPPADILALMISWTRSDPAFKIDVFDDPRAREFLRGHCNPDVARAFNWAREPAQRADIFRLARLFTVGGYFIDADDRAREGLEAHVPPNVEFFAHQEDLGSIGNNVMGAVPGHPAIEAALHEAVAAVLRGDQDIIWLSTGPGLLTRSLGRWFAEKPEATDERLSQVAILTLGEMRRAAAMHCHAAYKTTNRAWLNVAFKKRNGR